MDIKLIATDLDGTLLDSSKNLSSENIYALQRAADLGMYIVPCTGRFYNGMPQVVKDLPFVRYAITINGAVIYDAKENRTISQTCIPLERGLQILDWCSTLGVAYDCYIDGQGYMLRNHLENIEDYLDSKEYLKTLRSMRLPVEDLRGFAVKKGSEIQKIQMFTRDKSILKSAYAWLEENCPDLIGTSSLVNNLEINLREANKGTGLKKLAEYLGIPLKETMAFGDGGNDVRMMETAGTGIAMMNAIPAVKKAADLVTLSCNGSGVAYAINRLLLR